MAELGFSVTVGSNEPQVPRRLTTPQAVLVSELNISLANAKAAELAATLLRDRYTSSRPKSAEWNAISEALSRDAVLLFTECFGRPASGRIDPSVVFSGIQGGAEYVQFLTDVRNNYAAHTSGPLRQCEVCTLPEIPATEKWTLIYALSHQKPFDRAGAVKLLSFIRVGVEAIEARLAEAAEELSATVRAMSPDELRALPIAETSTPETHELGMGRKDFRRVRAGGPPPTRGRPKGQKP